MNSYRDKNMLTTKDVLETSLLTTMKISFKKVPASIR